MHEKYCMMYHQKEYSFPRESMVQIRLALVLLSEIALDSTYLLLSSIARLSSTLERY